MSRALALALVTTVLCGNPPTAQAGCSDCKFYDDSDGAQADGSSEDGFMSCQTGSCSNCDGCQKFSLTINSQSGRYCQCPKSAPMSVAGKYKRGDDLSKCNSKCPAAVAAAEEAAKVAAENKVSTSGAIITTAPTRTAALGGVVLVSAAVLFQN